MAKKRKNLFSLFTKTLRIPVIFLFAAITLSSLVLSGIGVFGMVILAPKAMQACKEVDSLLASQQAQANEILSQKRQDALAYEPEAAKQYRYASQMWVTGIGDSVMLATLDALYDRFPNGYFDAVRDYSLEERKQALIELENNNMLGDVIVFCLTDCGIGEQDYEQLLSHCQGKPTFWITTYGNSSDSNEALASFIAKHGNAYLIDWEPVAYANRKTYFLPDCRHPNETGSKAYASLIEAAITEDYLGYKFSS